MLPKKNQLLYLDTKENTFEVITQYQDTKPYKIVIFFSGIERNCSGSKFNQVIEGFRGKYSVEAICDVFEVSCSGDYIGPAIYIHLVTF